jgi:hypothetical protein
MFPMERGRFLLIAALAAVLTAPALAGAQTLETAVAEADRAALVNCLRESPEASRACIGSIAVVCAGQARGDRREAEIDCSRREAAVWRERLETAARALAPRLESGARSCFAAVQRSWESYAAQKCAFIADVQTAARAPTMQAGCELSEVAGRALDVERLARSQQGDQNRPRIER